MSKKMITVEEFAENLDRFRIPLSSMEREKRKGNIPYYGAAKVIDYVDDFTHSDLAVLIAEDGSVETLDGYPVLQLVDGKYWVNNHTHVLKGSDDNDTKYLYYALQTVKVAPFVTGAVQKKISQRALNSMSFPYFEDKSKRENIVNILSTFDQKIQLNTQINQTLEQIAQAIFKSWFIDFDPVKAKAEAKAQGATDEQANIVAMSVISGKSPDQLNAYQQTNPTDYQQLLELAQAFPSEFEEIDSVEVPKGWGIKKLPEIIDFLEGPGIRNWQYTDAKDGINFINIRCIQNGDLSLSSANKISKEEAFGKYAHFQLKENDIVISTSGTLGRFAIVRQEHLPLCLNTSVIRFRPIENKSTLAFIYGFVNNQLQYELETRASGSVQKNFGPTHLKSINMLVPNFELLKLHNVFMSNIFGKRKANLKEIELLEKTRDLLLPKLLNGEI